MGTKPRYAICSVCGRKVALSTKTGKIQAHGYSTWDYNKPQCAGSGEPPKKGT